MAIDFGRVRLRINNYGELIDWWISEEVHSLHGMIVQLDYIGVSNGADGRTDHSVS